MKNEIKIGLFLGGTLLILGIFIFIVGDMSELFKKPGYILNVRIESALGLEKSSSVKMAGIRIGYVKDIRLHGRQAEVVMNIYPPFKVPKGSRATLSSLGLLGERFMDIVPSDQPTYFAPGETMEGLPAVSFDQIGSLFLSIGDEIKQLSGSLKNIVNEETGDNLQQTLKNLTSLTAGLDDFVTRNKDGLGQTIKGAADAVADLSGRLSEISKNVDKVVSQYGALAEENRGSIKKDVEKIGEILAKIDDAVIKLNASLDKVQRGEGTLGRLLNEPNLLERAEGVVDDVRKISKDVSSLKAGFDFRGEYYGKSDLLRSSMSGRLWFEGNKFFQAQVVHDPWRQRFTYSFQGGLRWWNLVPKLGIIESTFGIGAEYYAFRDRLALGLEGFDFNQEPGPRFRATARFYPHKNIFLTVGVDNFTLTSRREVFFGMGFGIR
jgi:phospholipid/cholesterol/gamma-HCH transport system substrate-binding protein